MLTLTPLPSCGSVGDGGLKRGWRVARYGHDSCPCAIRKSPARTMKFSLLPHTCSPPISPRITAPASLRHVFAVRSHCTALEEARCAREICPFGARWAIRASTTHPGGPDGAARAFIEVSRGAPPKRASCGAPQLDPATPLHPVLPGCRLVSRR